MKFNDVQKGLGFALLAPLLYALKSAAIKFAPSAGVEFFVFSRFLCDFLLLAPFFIIYRNKLHSKQMLLHFVRAILVTISIYCSVYGIRHLALVDAILLEYTLPLFIPFIAWIWNRQKITLYSCFLLLMGFSSLFLLLKPKMDILHLASLASLATGLTAAITTVSIRNLSKTEHPVAILFYFNILSGGLALIPCLYHMDALPTLSFSFCWPFLLISFFGVLFQYAITRAYTLIPSHVAGNFAYFGVLFSALLGWLIWKEDLNALQGLGGTILIGSGLLMIRANKQNTPNELTKSSYTNPGK